ncbi:MAG: hypothetical protein JWR15_525 [Prosthecobacter sp.]|nr:hypothetical protein [Prosthecobacter sp.]
MRATPFTLCTGLLMALCVESSAQSEMGSAVQFNSPTLSQWSVSAGFSARRFKSQAGLGTAARPDARILGGNERGRGFLGFYHDGDPVHYDDGTVGIGGLRAQGSALATGTRMDSADQQKYAFTGGSPINPNGFAIPYYDVTFHSQRSSIASSLVAETATMDERTASGGYVEGAWEFYASNHLSAELTLGWSLAHDESTSGMRPLGTGQYKIRTINYAYSYVGYELGSPRTLFLITGDAPGTQGLGVPPSRYLRTTKDTSFEKIRFAAIGTTSLGVDAHEFKLAPRLNFRLNPWLKAGLSLGPTLNVVNYEVSGRWAWLSAKRAPLIGEERRSATDTAWGFLTEATLQADIGKSWFLEARAGYRWVQTVASHGLLDANIHLSGYDAGFGVGVRF